MLRDKIKIFKKSPHKTSLEDLRMKLIIDEAVAVMCSFSIWVIFSGYLDPFKKIGADTMIGQQRLSASIILILPSLFFADFLFRRKLSQIERKKEEVLDRQAFYLKNQDELKIVEEDIEFWSKMINRVHLVFALVLISLFAFIMFVHTFVLKWFLRKYYLIYLMIKISLC